MPPQVKDPKRRKMIVYASMAAALLLVVLLARRSSSSGSSGAAANQTAQPVSNPAVDPASYYSGGSGTGGVDYGPQLSTIDTDIQTLGQAVTAIQSGQQTAGTTTPGTGGDGGSITDVINAITGAIATGAGIDAAARSAVAPPAVNVTVRTAAAKQPGAGNTKAKKPTTKIGSAGLSASILSKPKTKTKKK